MVHLNRSTSSASEFPIRNILTIGDPAIVPTYIFVFASGIRKLELSLEFSLGTRSETLSNSSGQSTSPIINLQRNFVSAMFQQGDQAELPKQPCLLRTPRRKMFLNHIQKRCFRNRLYTGCPNGLAK
jgi:hypothetical protein